MKLKSELRECPTCGSLKLQKVRKDLIRQFNDIEYTVPDLEFHECPECGERLFSPDAVDKIQEYSPAFHKRSANRKKTIVREIADKVGEQPHQYGARTSKPRNSRKTRK